MMSDQPKAVKRLTFIGGIIALFCAAAYLGTEILGKDGAAACPEGQELTRNNPPHKTPRLVCR